MNIETMRKTLSDMYSARMVAKLKDSQVIAMYRRLQTNGKIK